MIIVGYVDNAPDTREPKIFAAPVKAKIKSTAVISRTGSSHLGALTLSVGFSYLGNKASDIAQVKKRVSITPRFEKFIKLKIYPLSQTATVEMAIYLPHFNLLAAKA